MSADIDTQESRRNFDFVKWLLVAILLFIAIVGNYYFQKYNFTLRVIIMSVIIALASAIALWTVKGKATLIFAREARTEIRKVIWPTRRETLQTTLIVTAVIAIMTLILLALDSILVHLISFITGLRF